MRRTVALCVPLLLGALVACEGRQKAHPAGAATHDEPHAGPAIVVLDLTDGVPEEPSTGLLGLSSKAASFNDLVHEMRHLERDKYGARDIVLKSSVRKFRL